MFLNGTHLLEMLFGTLRTMLGALRNFDALQLEERMSSAVEYTELIAKHSDKNWGLKNRRLQSSKDHMNTHTWTGDVNPMKVNVEACWTVGMTYAIAELRATEVYTPDELDITTLKRLNPDLTLLNYTGKAMINGKHAIDDDESKPDLCEEEVEVTNESVEAPEVAAGVPSDSMDTEVDDEDMDEDTDSCLVLDHVVDQKTITDLTEDDDEYFDLGDVIAEALDNEEEEELEAVEAEVPSTLDHDALPMCSISSSVISEVTTSEAEDSTSSLPSYISGDKGQKMYIARLLSEYSKGKTGGEVLKSIERVSRVGGALARGLKREVKIDTTETKEKEDVRCESIPMIMLR